MESNDEALELAQEEMESLKERAENGEIVDKEVKELRRKIGKLKEDRSRIVDAGM